MMPSVIPARLQFQCGHAALVTLPRVKGETATQRNDRVAREKMAALVRQCDFCAPSAAVLEPQLAVVHAAQVEMAQSDVVEPTRVAELAVVVASTPEPTWEIELEPAEPEVVEADIVAADIVEAVLEAVVVAATAAPVTAVTPEPKAIRKPRARRQPPSPARVVSGHRFAVRYEVERVIRATSVHDALRQLTAMGAVDVLAITLED
jgi:hypothetical protein